MATHDEALRALLAAERQALLSTLSFGAAPDLIHPAAAARSTSPLRTPARTTPA